MTHKISKLFKEERIFLLLWIGSLLLALGLGIWWYTESTTKNKEQLLSSDLPLDQRNKISGSLQWWKNIQIKLYNPLAFALVTTGTICTVCSFTLMATQLTRKTRKPS